MLILWKARQRDPAVGYARTFLTQMEESLATCIERDVKVVTNAGGLNPHGLAQRLDDRPNVGPGRGHRRGRRDDLTSRVQDLQAMAAFANLDAGGHWPTAG